MLNHPPEPLTTRMSSKGQVVIPRKACDALGVHAGTEFIIRVEADGYKLTPKKKGLDAFFALSRKQKGTTVAKAGVSREAEIGEYLVKKDTAAKRQAKQDFQSKKKEKMMRAVDTNLLLRAHLMDEPGVSERAVAALEQLRKRRALFIPSFVLLEFIWVLSRRKVSRPQIAGLIEELLEADGVTVGQHAVMARALLYFRSGKQGFSDYAILAEGEDAGAAQLVTFDRNLSKERANCIHPRDRF